MTRTRSLAVVLALALLGGVLAVAPPASAATVPPGFSDTFVARVSSPTAIAFMPDGRMLVAEQAGRLRVVTLDVDENPRTARAYGVMGMPTLALFVGGEPVTTVVGARPQAAVLAAIEPHLPVVAR